MPRNQHFLISFAVFMASMTVTSNSVASEIKKVDSLNPLVHAVAEYRCWKSTQVPKIKSELAQVIWPTTFYLFEHPVEVEGTVILGIGGQYQGPETDNDGNINGPDVWLQVLLKKIEMGAEQTITYTEQPSANDIKAFQKIPKPLGVDDKGNTTLLKYFKINVKNPSQSAAYSGAPNCPSCLKMKPAKCTITKVSKDIDVYQENQGIFKDALKSN